MVAYIIVVLVSLLGMTGFGAYGLWRLIHNADYDLAIGSILIGMGLSFVAGIVGLLIIAIIQAS